MSGFSSIAMPGSLPCGRAASGASPTSMFPVPHDAKARARGAIEDAMLNPSVRLKVKSVNVKIFDLSDAEQLMEYEKLWANLLSRPSEVVVDSRKDLVHRADGTSYWMKYVEYTEFCVDESGEL